MAQPGTTEALKKAKKLMKADDNLSVMQAIHEAVKQLLPNNPGLAAITRAEAWAALSAIVMGGIWTGHYRPPIREWEQQVEREKVLRALNRTIVRQRCKDQDNMSTMKRKTGAW